MTAAKLNELSAGAAAAAIAARKITSQDLVRTCLDRIAAREDEVGAWAYLDRDRAMAEARARDGEAPRGPLHGVPVGIKDIIDTADMPTTYGSPIYKGYRPGADAACVAMIRRAGGIALGKTVTTEFAYFAPGKTANPHNIRHTPGGSSSGSAAAVADCMVPAALGTQTAASIIRPATFCGVVGFKPTFGMYALSGIKPFAASFDTLGTITRTVDDTALMWDALHGAAGRVPARTAPPRIGLCRTPHWKDADKTSMDAVETAVRKFAAAGAQVEEVALPGPFADLVELHKALMAFESARAYATEHTARRADLSPQLVQLIETGFRIGIDQYLADRRRMEAAKAEAAPILARYDALLAPAARGEAPEGLMATGDPVFSRPWTLLQVPCIALPVTRGPNGLPLGIQLIGAAATDPALLATAKWAEERLS
jgi:Asp-tRNA(Asn)/Glu-tRNA(Gln) amidotransferase A subunit family amidase